MNGHSRLVTPDPISNSVVKKPNVPHGTAFLSGKWGKLFHLYFFGVAVHMVSQQSFEYLGFIAVRRGPGVPDTEFLLADPAVINEGGIGVDLGTVVELLEDRFVINGYHGDQRHDGMLYLMHPYAFHAELSADSLRRDRMRAMQHGTYALNGQIVMLTPSATPDRWDLTQSTAPLVGVRILPPDNLQVPTPDSPFRRAFLQHALKEAGVDLDRFR